MGIMTMMVLTTVHDNHYGVDKVVDRDNAVAYNDTTTTDDGGDGGGDGDDDDGSGGGGNGP